MPFMSPMTLSLPMLEAVSAPDASVAIAAIAMAAVATGGTIAIAKLWAADREREDATRKEALREWRELTDSLQRVGRAVERLTDIVNERRAG